MPPEYRPGPVPREALDFFRAKGWKVGFDYRDVWRKEHATAFTVAKAMRADVLLDIRQAVDSAISEGKTFRRFARELRPTLEAKGWWGRKSLVDPLTGELKFVQLGSPRRLRTIYRVNLRTARAAGQWERAQRTRSTHPYLIYALGPSKKHREEHAAWAGTILPLDDPWWSTHYPPNGWGCNCRVRQLSRREAARRGGTRQPPPPEFTTWRNKRTGGVETLEKGFDPGWNFNPGAVSRPHPGPPAAGREGGSPAIGLWRSDGSEV